jgi:arginine/lysine/ornithine decarboxylase
MDQSRAPVLEALAAYRRRGDVSFTPPGHKQGRGVDERVAAVLGTDLSPSICSHRTDSTTGCSTVASCRMRRT